MSEVKSSKQRAMSARDAGRQQEAIEALKKMKHHNAEVTKY